MPEVEVRNTTTASIARGGWTIPPDGKWHLINVPEYRIKEVIRASYLEHRFPGEDEEQVEEETEATEGQDQSQGSDGDTAPADEGNADSDDEEIEDDSPAGDDEDEIDEINLDDLSYSELQEMAKSYGIKANQSRGDLEQAILAADEEE